MRKKAFNQLPPLNRASTGGEMCARLVLDAQIKLAESQLQAEGVMLELTPGQLEIEKDNAA